MREQVIFFLNGERCEVAGEHAGWMFADYLRYVRSLPGTKIVCAEGDCGACTVLRWQPTLKSNRPVFVPVNSCILTVAQMDGSSLVTVDAISASGLAPVQEAMVSEHASQCGFCTPGFVMAMGGLVEKRLCQRNTQKPIGCQEAKNALTGNLCRCTGYQPILAAATRIDLKQCESVANQFVSKPQVKELKRIAKIPLQIRSPEFDCLAPTRLKDAAKALSRDSDVRLLSGGSDLGVVHNKRRLRLTRVVSLHLISELRTMKRSKGRLRVGAGVTLSELRREIKKDIPELARFLDLFASPQIKNVATLAGNVANGSPIADTPPFLLVSGAKVGVTGPASSRVIPIEKLYRGYRSLALKKGEIIAWIEFDIPKKSDRLALYKVSQRKDLDISTVNAALRLQLIKRRNGYSIQEPRIALGGVAATPVRLPKTEAALDGKVLSSEVLRSAVKTLGSEIAPMSDIRGSSAFRRIVAENLLMRFLREIQAV